MSLKQLIDNLRARISTPILFLLSTLFLTLILFLINPTLITKAWPIFLRTLGQIWVVLIIVFALLFLFNLFVTPQLVKRWLGHASGVKGWLIAIVGGVLSSGPIYLWYPLLADLEEHGMRPALAATFLYNRAIKIPLLPLLIQYFGVPFTLILSGYMLLFSIVQGWVVERFASGEDGRRREHAKRMG